MFDTDIEFSLTLYETTTSSKNGIYTKEECIDSIPLIYCPVCGKKL